MRRSVSFLCAGLLCGTLLSACKSDDVVIEANLPGIVTDPTLPTVVYASENTILSEEISLPELESTKRTARTEDMPDVATTTPTLPTEPDGEISVIPDIPNIPIGQLTSKTTTTATTTSVPTGSTASGSDRTSNSDQTWSASTTQSTAGTAILSGSLAGGEYEPKPLTNPVYRPYGYDSLDEKSRYIYDAVINTVSDHGSYVDLSEMNGITSEDYCDVYNLLYNDEDSLFYLGTKMQYAINQSTNEVRSATVFYDYSAAETQRMQAEIDTAVQRILAKIRPEMTHYDIVKLFYDELAENVVYDEDAENCRDIYGVFVDKRAICGGYSKAFSYLCDQVGIETLTITGDADEVPHMWNMVKLDGTWYHIDITYAVTESKLGNYVRYDYFCVNDDVIKRSRTVYDQPYSYPRASSRTYNYYVRNGLVANSYDQAYDMLYSSIIEASSSKALVAEILCGSREVYDEVSYELFSPARKKALDLMTDALTKSANKFKTDNISYASDDNTYVIKLFLEYTNR